MVLPKPPPNRKKIILELAILFILIGLIVFIILKYYRSTILTFEKPGEQTVENSSQPKQPSPKPSPTPSPSPLPSPKPIPHGKIGFTVSQSDKTKPQLNQGSLNPYDPTQGSLQTVTISAKDEQPITQVTAVLKTDNTVSQPVSFKLIDGSATDGTWQGSWTVADTYLYTYNLVLTAVSSRGQTSVEITLR